MRETVLEAVLRSADAPSEAQRNRFAAFLKKQYGQEVPLRWEQDPALEKGFRIECGKVVICNFGVRVGRNGQEC